MDVSSDQEGADGATGQPAASLADRQPGPPPGVALHEKGDIDRMMAGGERLHPMQGFDDDYTDIVDYIIRVTHRIWRKRAWACSTPTTSTTCRSTPPRA